MRLKQLTFYGTPKEYYFTHFMALNMGTSDVTELHREWLNCMSLRKSLGKRIWVSPFEGKKHLSQVIYKATNKIRSSREIVFEGGDNFSV